MSIFSRIFKKPDLECPRCFGKGHVDWEDIERLNKSLKWLPGKCAYCNGVGKIYKQNASKALVSTTYLTINLSTQERNRLIKQDKNALERSESFDKFLDNLIQKIENLYFVEKMSVELIYEELLKPTEEFEGYKIVEEELRDYIERVIALKKDL